MTLPELRIRIGADGSGVASGTALAKRSVKDMQQRMTEAAKTVTKSWAAVTAGWATFKAGAIAAGVSAARAATEISNLARAANTNTTTFQKWAAAARTVRVEQDKVSDILKDMTDHVGEFLSTGGGPLADFFENIAPKVGVTAEQFARLSGPEALQLYVSSLEKAGVSQSQMTFYLEAMSGDLTSLLPLLKNNGAELKRLGEAADQSGAIYTPEEIAAGKEMQKVFDEIGHTLSTATNKAILEHKDELVDLGNWIADKGIPAIAELSSEVGQMLKMFTDSAGAVDRFVKAWSLVTGGDPGPTADEAVDQQAVNTWSRKQDDPSTTGTWPLDENGNVDLGDGSPPLKTFNPVTTPPKKSDTGNGGRGGRGGGRGGDSIERDLEQIRRSFASEEELLDEQYKKRQDKLNEALEAEKLSREDFDALRLKALAEYHAAEARLDREAMQAKLGAWSGALGDLGALMSTGNKKLFAVGKAAAIAQSVLEGWSAAVSAHDKGMKIGGPPVAAVFTAASLAKTGAMIASIKSTTFEGGGGGGSAGGAASAAAAASPAQAPMEMRLVGVSADTILSGANLGTLLEKLNEEAGDRGYRLLVAG